MSKLNARVQMFLEACAVFNEDTGKFKAFVPGTPPDYKPTAIVMVAPCTPSAFSLKIKGLAVQMTLKPIDADLVNDLLADAGEIWVWAMEKAGLYP